LRYHQQGNRNGTLSKDAMNMLKSLVPPILIPAMKKLAAPWRTPSEERLFDGNEASFIKHVSKAKVYAEYGVGQSTDWVYRNTSATILAVDTSQQWIDKVIADKNEPRIDVQWVDLGALGDWGWPLTYKQRDNFIQYMKSPWVRSATPDVVLIDGRFRVCCFFNSILQAAPGTIIIFDDYLDRPQYHIVEELLPPFEWCGRQAIFSVAADLDRQRALALADRFLYVMD
jgi:hypothetical protein